MINFENTEVFGWEAAIRGMRNPMNSWDKSDSYWDFPERPDIFIIGKNDLALMKKLSKAGNDHAKFLRMINVTVDITSNHIWWAEFDTYKVGTVRNSCSKMHKIHIKEFVVDDFSTEGIEECGGRTIEVFLCTLNELERLRRLFNETNEKKYWRAIIELLPMGYNIKATVQLTYQVLKSIHHARKNHKLDEWRAFCKWSESLPYFKEVCINA
jgi:hypothetical protein